MNLDIETLSVIVGVTVAVGTAIAFIVRLEMKVNHVEEQIRNHPLLVSFTRYQQDEGVTGYFDYLLRNSRVER